MAFNTLSDFLRSTHSPPWRIQMTRAEISEGTTTNVLSVRLHRLLDTLPSNRTKAVQQPRQSKPIKPLGHSSHGPEANHIPARSAAASSIESRTSTRTLLHTLATRNMFAILLSSLIMSTTRGIQADQGQDQALDRVDWSGRILRQASPLSSLSQTHPRHRHLHRHRPRQQQIRLFSLGGAIKDLHGSTIWNATSDVIPANCPMRVPCAPSSSFEMTPCGGTTKKYTPMTQGSLRGNKSSMHAKLLRCR